MLSCQWLGLPQGKRKLRVLLMVCWSGLRQERRLQEGLLMTCLSGLRQERRLQELLMRRMCTFVVIVEWSGTACSSNCPLARLSQLDHRVIA